MNSRQRRKDRRGLARFIKMARKALGCMEQNLESDARLYVSLRAMAERK